MTLFDIGPDFKIRLNKEWILTIPQFKRLMHRDRGSLNDNDGRKKYQTIRELTFIFHLSDPRSPLENEEEFERREKALEYAELKEKDIDKSVLEALNEYEYLLSISVPTLGLLRASKATLQKLVDHFNNIDFSKVDKMGRQLHSPADHIKNVGGLSKLHKEIQAFEDVVLQELKQEKQARGKAELSDREQAGRGRTWLEGDFNPHKDGPTGTSKERSGAANNRETPNFDGDSLQLIESRGNAFANLASVIAGIEEADIEQEQERWTGEEE